MSISALIDFNLKLVSSFASENSIFIITTIVIVVVLFLIGEYRRGILFSIVPFSYPYSLFLKSVFQMPRPLQLTGPLFHAADSFSFPSSHTLVYTVFWGLLLYFTFVVKQIKNKYLLWLVRSICVYFIVLVGVSRVYLGFHFTRDVWGGYVFGLLYLLPLILIDRKKA